MLWSGQASGTIGTQTWRWILPKIFAASRVCMFKTRYTVHGRGANRNNTNRRPVWYLLFFRAGHWNRERTAAEVQRHREVLRITWRHKLRLVIQNRIKCVFRDNISLDDTTHFRDFLTVLVNSPYTTDGTFSKKSSPKMSKKLPKTGSSKHPWLTANPITWTSFFGT